MSHSYRDDAPADFSLFRRKILVGGGLLLGDFATISNVPSDAADASPADFANQFMEVSSLLIPHRLDRDVGVRLAAALKLKDPAFTAHVSDLIDIAKRKQAKIVEDFRPRAAHHGTIAGRNRRGGCRIRCRVGSRPDRRVQSAGRRLAQPGRPLKAI
jgi:Membrane bound FAD containing D-sorbitol dehydrogenase